MHTFKLCDVRYLDNVRTSLILYNQKSALPLRYLYIIPTSSRSTQLLSVREEATSGLQKLRSFHSTVPSKKSIISPFLQEISDVKNCYLEWTQKIDKSSDPTCQVLFCGK